MTAKKRKPGVSIPEAQRHTTKVQLRLPPREAERLRELAGDEGVTVSGWVAGKVKCARRCEIHDDEAAQCRRGSTVTLYRVHRHAGAHESIDCCDQHAAEIEAQGHYERERE